MNRRASILICSIGIAFGLAAAAWIVWYSYYLNFPFFFYDGLVAIAVLLLLAKKLGPRSLIVQNAANTLLLFTIALLLADTVLFVKTSISQRRAAVRNLTGTYSYEQARSNPDQFRIWWGRFLQQWKNVSKEIMIPDPKKRLWFKLKPRSSAPFFDGRITINSLGFRDDEFEVEKKGQFRIVAIGESTTMGIPLERDTRPWPKVLSRLIREELHCAKPVQVINAGVAVYNLRDNLIRLKEDVLRLKPDMILSYHGYNCFHFLDDTMAAVSDFPRPPEPLPQIRSRPSKLLEQTEYRLRILAYKRAHFRPPLTREKIAELRRAVLDSTYAKLCAELISIARTNRIKLAMLSYNMAVNGASPKEVVRFYSAGFPDVEYRIQANQLQNYMLEEIARRNPDVLYIDTSDELDGQHENFMDLAHFTQAGKNKLAENIFDGIKPYLLQHGELSCKEL